MSSLYAHSLKSGDLVISKRAARVSTQEMRMSILPSVFNTGKMAHDADLNLSKIFYH
jgi:hypothetical protein